MIVPLGVKAGDENERLVRTGTAHGLRKAQSRRLAEAGATSLEGRAVIGHKKDETFAYYAEKANRERLADAAMANLENRFANETE